MANIAFVFAGQGSQYEGMGKTLCEKSAAAREVFEIADKVRPGTSEQCFTAPLSELSITKNTQPCLYNVDLACAEALRENGIVPQAVAGFSLGEIAAITFSGVVSKEDGMKIVTKRGLLMQDAAEKVDSAMAAVLKLTNEQVEEICEKYEHVYPVNYNCPGQLVVAGLKDEINAFAEDVAAVKGRAKVLNVSGGFHSPFMAEAAEGLFEELRNYELKLPEIPTYSNYSAKAYSAGDDLSYFLMNQVKSPVRWQEIVENMIESGIDTFIECGAGKTLSGLIKKINKDVTVYNVQDAESLESVLAELKA
ncbi:MAG: ACP S-malonyltransferase [Clostridia bacterium]|nr:ACP S-malonyltransferase [Clostridia bacterium]